MTKKSRIHPCEPELDELMGIRVVLKGRKESLKKDKTRKAQFKEISKKLYAVRKQIERHQA
jgi:hypothetical protein